MRASTVAPASAPPRLPWAWGPPAPITHPDGEVAAAHGSDLRVATRAVRSTASPAALFLWLCQLRRAPYSYDVIDNFARRSPRVADPAMMQLRRGQTFMTIFTLVAFEPQRSLTLRMKDGWPTRVFGALDVVYRVDPLPDGDTRLAATLWLPRPPGPLGGLRRSLLAWGDLPMMRRQLLTLSALAAKEPHG